MSWFRLPFPRPVSAASAFEDDTPPGWHPLSLAALVAAWVAVAVNWPLWKTVMALPEVHGLRGAAFVAGFAVLVAVLTFLLLAPFAWRPTLKPVATLVLVAGAAGAHFMGSYGVVIDASMIVNVLQTDVRETRDLMNLRFVAGMAVLAVLPALWLWRARVRPARGWRHPAQLVGAALAAVLLAVLALLPVMADFSAAMRNHKQLRYLVTPLNSFYALGRVAWDANAAPKGPPVAIGTDARVAVAPAGGKPPLLLFVVGETARADRFSVNGYARPTTPEIARRGVVSFTDVTSCGTSTAASLPCMFSHLGREAYEARDGEFENLLDLLHKAGLAVLWLDNQSGCKGLCARVASAHARDPAPAEPPRPAGLCEGGECFDEALLHGLDERLAALDPERRARGVVLVLHQMGSHGPAYAKRSPAAFKRFTPECTTNALQQCSAEGLANAYDNSIVYTDHLLGRAIDWLARPALRATHAPALLYVSDHGESLGEKGLYLHGMPWALAPRVQTHVPMVMWAPAEGAGAGLMRCLAERRAGPVSHDHLFHTVLGLTGVRASEYREALDLTAKCPG